MKKRTILLSLATIPLLIACGGSSATTSATSKISGTVPGTLIEAFCEDGTYVQVSSTQNKTSQHPFEIEVPQNTNCRLVMTTNENDDANRVITPIGFINGTSTGSTIQLSGDINLSHIPLELEYADVNDTDNDHVIDPLHVDLNGSTNVNINNTPVYDTDKDGHIDAYEDDDNDGTVNAYEDDDNDGKYNIHDDDDNDHYPDYLEDDDDDGEMNHRDDDDDDSHPDYVEDNDGDGTRNHIDDDDDDGRPDYIEDDDNDGKKNHIDDDDNNGTPDYLDDDDNDGINNHEDDDDDNDGIHDDDDDYDDNDYDDNDDDDRNS